jgi:hypothetical protein
MQEETSANALIVGWDGESDASERRMMMRRAAVLRTGCSVVGNAVLAILVVAVFAALAGAQDAGWPKTLSNASGKLVCYQPQVDEWNKYQTLDVRLAFTLTPTGNKQQVGVITAQMQTSVNFDTHTVFLSNPQITSVTFPSLPPDKSQQLGTQVRTFLNPAATMTISLDRLVASVKKTQTPTSTADVNNKPPEIFCQHQAGNSPASERLAGNGAHRKFECSVRGERELAAVSGAGESAVLPIHGKGWMTSASLDGTFTATTQLPPGMSAVPANSNFASLKQFIPHRCG